MDRVADHLRSLALAVRRRRDDIGAAFSRRLREAAPEYYAVDESDLQDAGWAALYVLVDGALDVLAGASPPTTLPKPLSDEAIAAARSGLPWELIQRTYRLTHQVVWESVFPEMAALKLSRDDQALVLRMASDQMFYFFDRQAEAAAKVYEASRQEAKERSQRRLSELVGQVLDGVAVRDVQLGYRLAQPHVALVAWGVEPREAVLSIAASLHAEHLVVPAGVEHLWAWLGVPSAVTFAQVCDEIKPPPGTRIAIGSLYGGRSGFVTSHREARLAASLGARRLVPADEAAIRFDRVAVLSAALQDEVTARVSTDHVLAPLRKAGARSDELEATLVAYARAGLNARSAGRMLGVSERTVRYRVERLEEIFGANLRGMLPELVVAVTMSQALAEQRDARSATANPAEV